MSTDEKIDLDSVLNLSDEELLSMEYPDEPVEATDESKEENSDDSTEEEELASEEEDAASEEELEESNDALEPEESDEEVGEGADTFSDEGKDTDADSEKESQDIEKDKVESEVDDSTNYEEMYKQVLAPLKANGKEVKLESVEDLRNLASMGMNYQSKMVGIKPYRATAKKLENNKIDDATLDYLIDLHKGNPDAIQKMMKDHSVDPLDIDTEKETNYSPSNYSVSDNEVALDAVLEDIKSSPVFNTTVDIISNKWDESSKLVLLNNPSIIKVINDHVDVGIYDQITSKIDTERMLGRLSGLSDIEAYKQVGDAMQADGSFNTNPPAAPAVPTKKAVIDPKVKKRKKAASSTKSRKTTTKSGSDFDPLSMSDEDFEKATANKYL